MRILHTADWHLNARWYGHPRNEDLKRILEQIRDYLDTYHVDVMVVAGDVLEKSSDSDEIRAAVKIIKDAFLPFLERGGTIIAISGNHDDDALFEAMRLALDMVVPDQANLNGMDPSGRLYLVARPHVLRLTDQQGEVVQFALMPYPEPSVYLRREDVNITSPAELHQRLQTRFVQILETLRAQLEETPQHPAVLVSHVHVRGVQMPSLYKLTEAEDVIFEPGDIPEHWAYVAYGHIHRPQRAKLGADHIRYSGSIDRMQTDERDDEKQAILVEITQRQRKLIQELPLNATPIYQIEIKDPDTEIPLLVERYPEAQRALVSYTLHYDPVRHNREDLRTAIESVFPRCRYPTFRELGKLDLSTGEFSPDRLSDVVGTTRTYLDHQLKDSADRVELLALAEALLSEELSS